MTTATKTKENQQLKSAERAFKTVVRQLAKAGFLPERSWNEHILRSLWTGSLDHGTFSLAAFYAAWTRGEEVLASVHIDLLKPVSQSFPHWDHSWPNGWTPRYIDINNREVIGFPSRFAVGHPHLDYGTPIESIRFFLNWLRKHCA